MDMKSVGIRDILLFGAALVGVFDERRRRRRTSMCVLRVVQYEG